MFEDCSAAGSWGAAASSNTRIVFLSCARASLSCGGAVSNDDPRFLQVAWSRACHEPWSHTASQPPCPPPSTLPWSPSTPFPPVRKASINIYRSAASRVAFSIFPSFVCLPRSAGGRQAFPEQAAGLDHTF